MLHAMPSETRYRADGRPTRRGAPSAWLALVSLAAVTAAMAQQRARRVEPAGIPVRFTMIENYRSGLVWQLLRGCRPVVAGLRAAGFAGGWLSPEARSRR